VTPILISLAGSFGATSRFVLDGHLRNKYRHDFPWATIIINVSGSLFLGIVTGALLKHRGFSNIETVIGTGFCGGYTTFSTASFETVRLFEQRRYVAALSQALGSLVMAVIAAAAGFIGHQI